MVKGTHKNILNATLRLIEKGVDIRKLTLTQIAAEANISRQAVYGKHFTSVDDILQEIRHQIDDSIFHDFENALVDNKDVYSIIANNILPNIYEKRSFIKVMYSNSDYSWKNYLKVRYVNLLLTHYQNQFLNHSLIFSDQQMLNIICDYIMTIIEEWLSEDVPVVPNKFKKEFLNLMSTSPFNILQKPCHS